MQYFTQYNQPNSRKKSQIDNVDIMNAFCKTMFLLTNFKKHLESSLDRTPNCCRNLVIFRSKII